VENLAAGLAPRIPGSILALCVYNPGTIAQYTIGTSFADVDATNLVVTFTVPASGKVLVRGMVAAVPGVNGIAVNLREGSSDLSGTEQTLSDQYGAGKVDRRSFAMYVSGLTPDASKTYKLGAVANTSITNGIRAGGTGTTQTAGPAILEVVAAP
jgi:hypothetical protein